MPIIGTIASSTRQGLATGSFESIASTTLTSNSSSVTFSSISSAYTHLQIRTMTRFAGGDSGWAIYFNGDTTASNYYATNMAGTGDSVYTQNLNDPIQIWYMPNNSFTASLYAISIIDILDYTNTSKKKTTRGIWAIPTNNTSQPTGRVGLNNVLWNNTSAITTIRFDSRNLGSTSDFSAGSTFALYGIKAA